MYSDEWLKNGYRCSDRIGIGNEEPIYYRFWYDNEQKIGATIDFEYAEDAHYEFLWNEFEKLISLWGGEDNFMSGMQKFFPKKQPYYIFSRFLDENGIAYKRIVFY